MLGINTTKMNDLDSLCSKDKSNYFVIFVTDKNIFSM